MILTIKGKALNEQEEAKSDLIKSVDSFFGFKVKESVVLLFIDSNFATNHHTRIDNNDDSLENIIDIVRKVPRDAQSVGIICISISDDMQTAQRELITAMRFILAADGIPLDALASDGKRWESLTGESGILDDTPSTLEYALAARGIFNFPSREDAIADIHHTEPSGAVADEIQKLLQTCPLKSSELAAWRQGIIEFCDAYDYRELSDSDVATLVFASADVSTSHALIHQLAVTEKPSQMLHLWQRVFRRTPEEYRFATAEILAWACLLEGSRWFVPELAPYCNESSPTFRAMMIALNYNLSPHMITMGLQQSNLLSAKDNMEALLAPMVLSAIKYIVENRDKELHEE